MADEQAPHVDFTREDAPRHECGYIEGTFACKIRHVQMNTGFAKAYEDFK